MEGFDYIVDLAGKYAAAREELETYAEQIADIRRRAIRQKLPALKRRIAEVSAARDELRNAIEDNAELFEKPKTRAVDGVKVGFRKAKGKITVADETKTIALIRKRLPEYETQLIVKKERVDKTAMGKLTARQMARIGAELTDDTDEVVIATAASDIDKLVDALLEGEEDAA